LFVAGLARQPPIAKGATTGDLALTVYEAINGIRFGANPQNLIYSSISFVIFVAGTGITVFLDFEP
jgi:hypothetical protein